MNMPGHTAAGTAPESTYGSSRRHVRVWFGPHVIAQKVTGVVAAAHYEAAMKRRFAALQVTNEPVVPR